jgi:hypothetical protein
MQMTEKMIVKKNLEMLEKKLLFWIGLGPYRQVTVSDYIWKHGGYTTPSTSEQNASCDKK